MSRQGRGATDNLTISVLPENLIWRNSFLRALALCLKSVGLPAIGGLMNRDTFPGTNLYACVSRLADDIADRIALAGHPVEIDEIVKEVWGHHFAGTLTEEEAEALHEAARTRRETFQERRTDTRPKSRTAASSAPRGSARRPQRTPDRQASIERRRRLVASGPLPPPLAARFTWGEQAVMRIVGNECRAHGCCFLHIDAIAARAGVHRTTVQNALREAQGRGEVPGVPIISVQERRRKGQRSLTNIIRIVSREWSDWLHKGRRWPGEGVGSKRTPAEKSNTTDTDLFLRGRSPWGIPDGVYSCEEVA